MKHILDIPRTAMEVFNMLPEGTLCEVIDNTIYMSPSPTTQHQRLLGKIFSKLQTFVEEHHIGEAFIAPCDVYLDNEQSVVQPDILLVTRERENIIAQKGIIGAPNLVIEILSTNKKHDQERKLELYQRDHIAEYIIIDPETKQVWQYSLQGKIYEAQTTDAGQLYIHAVDLSLTF